MELFMYDRPRAWGLGPQTAIPLSEWWPVSHLETSPASAGWQLNSSLQEATVFAALTLYMDVGFPGKQGPAAELPSMYGLIL